MKNFLKVIVLVSAVSLISCKKTSDSTSPKLELLQHIWSVVSLNGEVLRYIGTANDYYNFSTDNFLYTYVAKKFDTSYYQLSANNDILLLYPITNGVKSNSPVEYLIKDLSATQLILANGTGSPPVSVLDSLKR